MVKTEQKLEKSTEINIRLGCQKAYSPSTKEESVICPEKDTREQALATCAKKFAEGIKDISGVIKTLNEIDQARQLLMQNCMEQKGYEY